MHRFRTTRWSLVVDAGDATPGSRRALDELCRVYRPPVLAFVRRCGHAPQEAEDLTQAFFETLLRRRTYAAADPGRGRFRVFLRVALRRFLGAQAEARQAAKRGHGEAALSLDDRLAQALPAQDEAPDAAFERDWAQAVLQQAAATLQAEADASGKGELFRALRPWLFDSPDSADMDALAQRLSLRRNTLAVALHRLRQRLHDQVRRELAETVADERELEAELGVLHGALGGARAA